ncbi:MAG: hypothetical protein JSR46_07095, partial [Verrucomicrobia bacterium]|nr:hypothetical protein [Verrucomicrobiota bacterium]
VSSEVAKAGYVRAGQLPSSFPCFTHVRGNNKNRYCLSGGQVCAVGAITVEGKNKEQCIEALKKAPLSAKDKEAYLSELDKVASELTYSNPITLFIPTTNAIKPESLSLATINVAQKKAKTVSSYTAFIR